MKEKISFLSFYKQIRGINKYFKINKGERRKKRRKKSKNNEFDKMKGQVY